MNKFLKILHEVLVGIMIAAVIYGLYCLICYRIDLYKRKHPGTTTFDFWMDSGRK